MDVRYKINRHNQRCFRDGSQNVQCLYLEFKWDEGTGELSGGKGEYGRITCPDGFAHFIDKCVEITATPTVSSFDDATATCDTVEKKLFKSRGFIQFSALKMYFGSISLSSSFWIGKWEDIENDIYGKQMEWTDDGKTAAGY